MNINDLKIPILQAPIDTSTNLASAVSNAGGMGSVQGTWKNPNDAAALVDELIRKTKNPFFVNFVLSFTPHSLEAVIEAGAPAVTFSWGIEPELIKLSHKKGVAVGIQIGSIEGAKMAASNDADFVICQGIEAGGHVQSTTSLSILLPQVVEALGNVPVFAAGGLADADDIAWARNQGANGAMLGTRFVATEECSAHPLYKGALLESNGLDTVYTVCFDGGWEQAPHRVLRNQTFKDWEAAGCPPKGKRPGEFDIVATDSSGFEVNRYALSYPRASHNGSLVNDMCLYAGTGCSKILDLPSASDLVANLYLNSQPGK